MRFQLPVSELAEAVKLYAYLGRTFTVEIRP